MRARLGMSLVLLVCVSSGSAWSDPSHIGPPFDEPVTHEDCEAVLASCAQRAEAESTGAISIESSVASTEGVPLGSAWSQADAGFSTAFVLSEPAQAVDITFEVFVQDASVHTAPGEYPGGRPYGRVDFFAVALHRGCSCEASDLVFVVGFDTDHRRDWGFLSTMTLADADGGTIPAGTINIVGWLDAWAATGSTVAYAFPGSGSARAEAHATVRALTVEPL